VKELEVGKEGGGCDLMIVIGTALAVFPFSGTVDLVPKDCPQVLMNLENTEESGYDFTDVYSYPNRLFIRGECDSTIMKLCQSLGWHDQLEKMVKAHQSLPKNTKEVKSKVPNSK